MEPMCRIMFYNQLPTSDTIHKWTLAPEKGRCHIGALIDVEPGHWGGHQVSGHGTDVLKSCFIINCQLLTPFTSGPRLQKGPVPYRCPHRCRTRTLGRTPNVQPWIRCVKSGFIINSHLLTPFTSGTWLQKWAGFTSVPSSMWNQDTGSVSKCQAMKPMCQIMFCNQLPTSDTIQNWTLAPEVDRFHIGALTDVEHGLQVSSHGTDVSNHVL